MTLRPARSLVLGSLLSIVLVATALSSSDTSIAATDALSCPDPGPGRVTCFAKLRRSSAARTPAGLSPNKVKKAYRWSTSPTAGAGQTIAIVVAYNGGTVEQDLAVFSARFGLPSCTTANGCLTLLNQNPDPGPGAGPPPPGLELWAFEANLDVQWTHAIAPGARKIVVFANSNTLADMFDGGVWVANKAGAGYVSMSWGTANEEPDLTVFDELLDDDPDYDSDGKSYFAAAGDTGAVVTYPSSSPFVTSVGGTRIKFRKGKFRRESAWAGSGGGCSAIEDASAAQAAFAGYAATGCEGKRATPDIALLGDPATGVPVYTAPGVVPWASRWIVAAGTSLGSPLGAARAATKGTLVDQSAIYGEALSYRDITLGDTGLLCATGYEMCSGRGSWLGP